LSYPSDTDEDAIMEAAIDAGAADVVSNDDGSVDVLSEPGDLNAVREVMRAARLEPEQGEVTMRASTTAALRVREAETTLKLLDALDDLDDVQRVYSNAEFPEELLEATA